VLGAALATGQVVGILAVAAGIIGHPRSAARGPSRRHRACARRRRLHRRYTLVDREG
jgi:hypothetical protein